MINVRRGVFETNSSSSHSVTIQRGIECAPDLTVSDDSYVHVKMGCYGWEFKKLSSQTEKLSYLMTMAWEKFEGNHYSSQESYDKAIDEFMQSKSYEWISNEVAEYMRRYGIKCHGVIIDNKMEEYAWIDHQSTVWYSGALDFLCQNDTSVKDFVFNPGVVMKTGNDNEEPPEWW